MLELNFHPFPALITERLILRKLRVTDDENIFLLRANEQVNKYLENFKHHTIEQTRIFIEKVFKGVQNNESIDWVITLKDSNQFIGTICLWNISKEEEKAETGYILNPDFQGNGYMFEALTKVIEYGFNTMRLITIEAYTHINNEKSTRLLRKAKFKLKPYPKAPENNTHVIFTLSKEDYSNL